LSRVLTRAAFENAVRMCAAIGGSTNAVMHLLALAGRIGVPFELDDWDTLGRGVPLLVNLMPAGDYLMEDFYYAGGVPAVMAAMGDLIDGSALTVSGGTISDQAVPADQAGTEVIRPQERALQPHAGIAVLRGNLAPGGAIIKPTAATPELMRHSGRAVTFETIEDFKERIDDPSLDVDSDCILVLKGCGPRGYPGMPEVGNMQLPRKLLAQGVTDMVRVSDARMSGTAFGTVVLHVTPESAAGGPLGLIEDGDTISLDVAARTIDLDVSEPELERRRRCWSPPVSEYGRGYYRLYLDHVLQADRGADFDFLIGASGGVVPRESH
ncbi:MAG: dihydroxy-acid dehydratase, partial [Acidimicrobiia bacterium]